MLTDIKAVGAEEVLTLRVFRRGDILGVVTDFREHDNNALASAIGIARLGLRSLTGRIDDAIGGKGSFGMAVQKVVNKGLMEPSNSEERCIIQTREASDHE